MNPLHDPLMSELHSKKDASYDLWFRAKVQVSIDSKAPRIPHEQVVAEMDALIDEIGARNTPHRA